MRLLRYVLGALLIATFFVAEEASAKGKVVPNIYIFGFSASFSDSIVYFTDVQKVDSAWIDTKSKFLLGRENYSYQLKNYLANKLNQKNRTCLVMYGRSRKEAEDKYLKMKKIYVDKGKGLYDVRYIREAEFKFLPIDMSYEIGETVTTGPQTNSPAKGK